MFTFDLKSAYLQIPLAEECKKYFGFSIEDDQGNSILFSYENLPFGYNDAARCLTKVMRSPLHRWRSMGIPVFLHIDDGFSNAKPKDRCFMNFVQVRSDLVSYGLLTSEPKCAWGARLRLTWTGFEWDTLNFKSWVPEQKLEKALEKIRQLKEKKGGWVMVRELASVVGLLGSFQPAMGDIARFYTRSMLTQVAEVSEAGGWKAKLCLSERALGELDFWEKNMRGINGHRMRKEDKVIRVYHDMNLI